LDEIFWALDLEGWEEVIRMYLIGLQRGLGTLRVEKIGLSFDNVKR
jgi:hypothetical protein